MGYPTRHAFARRADHGVEKALIVIGRVMICGEELATEVHVQAVLAIGNGHGALVFALFERDGLTGAGGKGRHNPDQPDAALRFARPAREALPSCRRPQPRSHGPGQGPHHLPKRDNACARDYRRGR